MKNILLHLRLNMSLVLAPIFLWGFLLSEGYFNQNFIIAFISFHIFLYGGSNAYNSYYDKDEGPIGGLKNPPKVNDNLLYVSIVLKIIGQILAFSVNNITAFIYFMFFVLSILYSYKKSRWKAKPFLSILTVGLGQGGLAFAAGWFSGNEYLNNITIFTLGMLTTIFMSLGVYPLTQLYQIEEDRKRNDFTFAVYWGIKKSFVFSAICILISSISMLSVIYIKKYYIDFTLILFFYVYFLIHLFLWSKKFDENGIMNNYDKIMKLNYYNGFGFTIYILYRLLRP